MSRKSAYALKSRDPVFASAWAAAVTAGARASLEGDKVKEVEGALVSASRGDTSPSRIDRERAFVRRMAALRESTPLADPWPAQ